MLRSLNYTKGVFLMIRFVMINYNQRHWALEDYTDTLMDTIKNELKATELEFYSNKDRIRKASLILNEKEYFISFTSIITSDTSQLKIDIKPNQNRFLDHDLHNLKIKIKDSMVKEWEKCVWLEDSQSESFAESLYKDIHSVENSLRRLINIILFYRLGGDWWDKYMPANIIEKYNERNDPYKQRTPSFDNIHSNLMSIDTSDLVKILGHKTYKLKSENIFQNKNIKKNDPFDFFTEIEETNQELETKLSLFQNIMNNFINKSEKKQNLQKQLFELLKDQMEIENNFWEGYFSEWFSCNSRSFFGKWHNFNTDRNHIAHNKLIDTKLYEKFNKNNKELLSIIIEAENKFLAHLETEATQYLEELEADYRAEEFQNNLDFKEMMEEEAGVRILDVDKIIENFQEYITESFDDIINGYYFRSDLEMHYIEPLLTENAEIFQISQSSTSKSISVTIEPEINDSVGESSTVKLKIYLNELLSKEFEISFNNGEIIYDEDQANYMPVSEDIFYVEGLKELEVHINNILESELTEIDTDNVSEEPCEQCGNYTVFFPDGFFDFESEYEIGECMNCNHINEKGSCVRCETVLDQKKIELCENCKEDIDSL